MTLGEVMQAASAFLIVQTAFNWLVENYPRLADWTASARRLASLLVSLDHLERADREETTGRIVRRQTEDGRSGCHRPAIARTSVLLPLPGFADDKHLLAGGDRDIGFVTTALPSFKVTERFRRASWDDDRRAEAIRSRANHRLVSQFRYSRSKNAKDQVR